MFLAPMLSLPCKPSEIGRWFSPVAAAGLLAAALWNVPAAHAQAPAAALAEVHQLLEQGKTQDAAKLVQSHLKRDANDVQMRFMQGVVAVELKKYDQAIEVFTALTRDYPSLPEPYNNLAVLHALKGDDRKAAQVLEQAIGTNPSYATAHENLGDLYARMASDAYAKALQLDSSRQAIQPKLSLIKQIFPADGAVVAAAPIAKPATSAAVAATPVVSVPAAAAANASAPVVPAAEPVVVPAPSVPATTAASVAAAADKPAPAAPATPAPDATVSKQVENAVMAWARAWAKQDMSAYYAAYSAQFDAPNGNLAAWKAERKERIVGKPAITVDVRDLKVRVKGEQAEANFRQFYASGSYKATTRKTLHMRHENGKWRILREETGR